MSVSIDPAPVAESARLPVFLSLSGVAELAGRPANVCLQPLPRQYSLSFPCLISYLPPLSLESAECIPSHVPQRWRYVRCCYQLDCDSKLPTDSGPQSTPIHILSNDALLNVFSLCRPVLLYDDEAEDNRNLEGGDWDGERWWYKLVRVCRRWRYLILGSPSYLRLCLVCTTGTPVAHMLANSPPLPLIIDHILKGQDHDIAAEDEEGMLLALQHRHRVQRIPLSRCPSQICRSSSQRWMKNFRC